MMKTFFHSNFFGFKKEKRLIFFSLEAHEAQKKQEEKVEGVMKSNEENIEAELDEKIEDKEESIKKLLEELNGYIDDGELNDQEIINAFCEACGEDIDEAHQLADFLGVNLDHFFHREKNRKEDTPPAINISKESVKTDKTTRKVGYHESGIISENDTEQSIETTGLKPCVGVILEALNSDGKKVACMLHFAPQFLNHDKEAQKKHIGITNELLQEGLSQMKQAGVNIDDLNSFKAILSGKSDYKGKQWENMTPAERNAHNVIKVLNEKGVKNIEENYNPALDYRTLSYNIKTGEYDIRPDEKKDKADMDLGIPDAADIIDIGAIGGDPVAASKYGFFEFPELKMPTESSDRKKVEIPEELSDFTKVLQDNFQIKIGGDDIPKLREYQTRIDDFSSFGSFLGEYKKVTNEDFILVDDLDNFIKLYKVPNILPFLKQNYNKKLFRQIGYQKYEPTFNTFIVLFYLQDEPEFKDLVGKKDLKLEEIQEKIKGLSFERKKEIIAKLKNQNAQFFMGELLCNNNFQEQNQILSDMLGEGFSQKLETFNSTNDVSLEIAGINRNDEIVFVNTLKKGNKNPIFIKISLKEIQEGKIDSILPAQFEQENKKSENLSLGQEEFDIAKDGKTSVLMLVTYPNDTKDIAQDDITRKKQIYKESHGVKDENLRTEEIEDMEQDKILELIENGIQKAVNEGQEEFVLEYTSHGFIGGEIGLGGGKGSGIDTTRIANLLNKYADKIKITIVSHTCRGGWQVAKYQEAFAKNPKLKGAKIHTASGINPETTTFEPKDQIIKSKNLSENTDNPYDYYFSLAYEMNPNITYAQARTFAGRMVIENYPTQGTESYYIGPEITGIKNSPYNLESEMDKHEGLVGFNPNYRRIDSPYTPGSYVQEVYPLNP